MSLFTLATQPQISPEIGDESTPDSTVRDHPWHPGTGTVAVTPGGRGEFRPASCRQD